MDIKIGFVHPPNATTEPNFEETYKSMVKLSRPSLVSAPPVRILDIQYVTLPILGVIDTRHRHDSL